jgi:hypothetical protein
MPTHTLHRDYRELSKENAISFANKNKTVCSDSSKSLAGSSGLKEDVNEKLAWRNSTAEKVSK